MVTVCVCVCLRALISERQINERNNDLCVNSCVGNFTVILNSALQYSTMCYTSSTHSEFPSAPRLIFSLLFSRLSCYAARQQLQTFDALQPPTNLKHTETTHNAICTPNLAVAPPVRPLRRNFVALLFAEKPLSSSLSSRPGDARTR